MVDLAGHITNITTVVTAVVTWATDVLALFMEPPLVIFVGVGIAIAVLKFGKRLVMIRR